MHLQIGLRGLLEELIDLRLICAAVHLKHTVRDGGVGERHADCKSVELSLHRAVAASTVPATQAWGLSQLL